MNNSLLAQATNPPTGGSGLTKQQIIGRLNSLIKDKETIEVPLQDKVIGQVSPITDLGVLVSSLASVGLILASLAFLIYLILGGIRWVLANGDSGKLEEAKNTITNGFIGLAVTAAAWAIFLLVTYFLGIDIAGGAFSGAGGGSGSAGGGTAATCAGGITIGATTSDGGAGGYCTGGAATVRCVAAGQGASGFNYPHFEPVCCSSGTPNTSYQFEKPGGQC